MPEDPIDARIAEWLEALEAKHLADLRIAEVTRALRALSSAYVQRRHVVAGGGTLDSAGKRAAFALFYAPLHLLTTLAVVRGLGAEGSKPASVVDIGCGTGAAGAAFALATGGTAFVKGFDRNAWAVDEARWTYRQLRLQGQTRQADAARLPPLRKGDVAVVGYTLNELSPDKREAVELQLVAAAAAGAAVLILEPISRSITPWWSVTARRFEAAGGRADEWRFPLDRPPLLALLDRAAGLDHREVTVRSIYVAGEGTDRHPH